MGTRERGQVATALLIVVGLLIMAFVVVAVLPLGEAGDKRSGAQKGADAAALAAARSAQDETPHVLRTWLAAGAKGRPSWAGGTAQAAAQGFAARNDADVTSFRAAGRRYSVTTTGREVTTQGGRATASASAELKFDPSECRITLPGGLPVPSSATSTTTPPATSTSPSSGNPTTTSPSSTTPKPPPPALVLRCDRQEFRVVQVAGGGFELMVSDRALLDAVAPRLV